MGGNFTSLSKKWRKVGVEPVPQPFRRLFVSYDMEQETAALDTLSLCVPQKRAISVFRSRGSVSEKNIFYPLPESTVPSSPRALERLCSTIKPVPHGAIRHRTGDREPVHII